MVQVRCVRMFVALRIVPVPVTVLFDGHGYMTVRMVPVVM